MTLLKRFYKLLFGIVFGFMTLSFSGNAQIGGLYSFNLLQLPYSARQAGLGGINISSRNVGAGLFLANPGLLNTDSGSALEINYNPYAGLAKHTNLTFRIQRNANQRIGFGLQYQSYGQFDGYDLNGNSTGTFTANEVVAIGHYAYRTGPFMLGANAKFAGSFIDSYTSFAVAFDMGASFMHPTEDFTVSLLVKNAGAVLKSYQNIPIDLTPIDVQAGVSYKFKYMPLRISTTLHQLNRFDVVYFDPSQNVKVNPDGTTSPLEKKLTEKIFRHVIIGGEFLLGKNFHLFGGYNHLARKEMKQNDGASGAAGYSLGFMLRVRQLQFQYAHNFTTLAAGANFLSLNYSI